MSRTPQSQAETIVEEKSASLVVFFLKQDGLYQVTSESSAAKKVPIDVMIAPNQGFPEKPPYVIGGLNQTKLYFLKSKDGKKYTSLALYDLETQQETEIDSADGEKELRELILSPDNTRIAYILGVRNLAEMENTETEDLIVRDTQSGEIVDRFTRKTNFTSFSLKGWLDGDNLIFATGWEGEGYYHYKIGSKEVSEEIATLGSSGMGGNERVILQNDLGQYGFINNSNPEITGNITAVDGAFFRIDHKSPPRFLSNHEITEMIPFGDQFYYLAQISERANEWQNYGVDIFRVDHNGLQDERLTQDGESGMKKQHLKVSVDGRFLTYDAFYSSDINYENQNSNFEANSSWVYDTQLGKAYKVSEQATFPTLIWQR